ncbi:MAG: ABC transporter ATP-binding protein [candidate division NC10 bacterium]|nr:ABC transporter ATP-binding protein [candidate division NC10 bacterium]
MRAIEVENVSKQFRMRTVVSHTTLKTSLVNFFAGQSQPKRESSFQALRGVTLAVEQGQTLGIIGCNGSGKSTLLKLLAKILQPDSGRVEVNGKVSALLELGAGFHPEFTGRENVLINGIVLGLTKKEVKRRFPEIVHFAELEPFIDEPVRTYSSGMYMRLGFAVAVHTDPDILLIDEVLAVGDEIFQKKCAEKIVEFQRKGKTIILVSHDLSAAERWCDEVVWLDEGAVRVRGTPEQVIGLYLQAVADREAGAGVSDQVLEEEIEISEDAPPALTITSPQPPSTKEGVSDERESEERGGGRRWGSGEIEIVSVRLLDQHGQERSLYQSGEGATVQIRYQMHHAVEETVFGFAIIREDGLWCYGTNTQTEKISIPPLGREGVVEVYLKSLNLIAGRYCLDVAVHREDGAPYDYHSRLCPFSVSSEVQDVGVFRVPHRWAIRPGLQGRA